MKKKLLLLLAVFAVKFAVAQTITINGSVKDIDGNIVPLAFVQDKADKTATRADSTGRFSLKASSNAVLFISSSGYEPKVIDVNGNTGITVVLRTDKKTPVAAQKDVATSIAAGTVADYNGVGATLMYGHIPVSNMLLPSFHPVEDTRGSRYMFKDWVAGFVVSSKDSVYKNPNYGFNYDKIGGGLLLTQDKHAAIEIDPSEIKSFTIYNEFNQPQVYEYTPEISKTRFPQLIADGKHYKIYKLTNTKLVKNNFHTDGMTSTGNNYDEYVDEYVYYSYNVQSRQIQQFSLKKKSLKAAFAGDAQKIDSFSDAYSGSIDDGFLKSLGEYLNQ